MEAEERDEKEMIRRGCGGECDEEGGEGEGGEGGEVATELKITS